MGTELCGVSVAVICFHSLLFFSFPGVFPFVVLPLLDELPLSLLVLSPLLSTSVPLLLLFLLAIHFFGLVIDVSICIRVPVHSLLSTALARGGGAGSVEILVLDDPIGLLRLIDPLAVHIDGVVQV